MPEELRIAVLPGDGIGVEVTAAGLEVLQAAQEKIGGFRLVLQHLEGGAAHYLATGAALPDAAMRACERADAILFGAMGLPDVRYANGTEIAPQLDIREHLQLYAGVRPIRALAGLPRVLADERAGSIDFVIIREQTEGFFHSRGTPNIVADEIAYDTSALSRKGCERVFDFAFRLAENRKRGGRPGKVTCVDKANVLSSMAFMRRVFDERARLHPAIQAEHCYIDAMALNLVRQPWNYDVIATENLFGDIISDLGGGLVGGMGLAPSGDIGDEHALFQPAHGSAPDIAGTGRANPTAMFLSAAMMLQWLGERHALPACVEAARAIEQGVDAIYASGAVKPYEFGGTDGNRELTRALLAKMRG
jgi:3-isopropylmalate dehydrogenase